MSDTTDSVRLNKFLALHVGISRREADDLIAEGRVLIDDIPATMGARVSEASVVKLNSQTISHVTAYEYIMLHKPVGYVCSRKQQGDNPTVYNLIPPKYHALKPVGRLDRDSSGLILFTNDGDFAQRMTHPSYHKVKQYEVTLDHALEPLHQQMISDFGVDLPDGKSQLTLEKRTDNRIEWGVTMHEGRNRQIRRTFAALGYMVMTLHRTDFGAYHLGGLESGKFETVTAK